MAKTIEIKNKPIRFKLIAFKVGCMFNLENQPHTIPVRSALMAATKAVSVKPKRVTLPKAMNTDAIIAGTTPPKAAAMAIAR